MLRYCDIHGWVEVPDGPPNQILKCATCNTVLKAEPTPGTRGAPATPAIPPQKPTPHARVDKVLHQSAFLAAYGRLGNITKAAAEAEIGRSQHYEWLEDAEYERRFLEAHKLAIQTIVDRAQELAVAGDARLMAKLLESIPPTMMPIGWNFNPVHRSEVSGPGGGAIETKEVSARDALASRIASLTTASDPPSGN